MAAVTHGVITYSEANATSYTSDSFTPAAGDLLVGMVAATATGVGTTTFSTSDGESFDQVIEDETDNYLFVGTSLAAANSQTATFDTPSDAATRCGIAVARISGMTLLGSAAVRQTKTATGNDATTPAATFDAAPLSGSVILAFLQVTSNTSPVVTPPSGFTEGGESVAATENGALEYAYKDSNGPTTVTWGSGIASGGVWVATIVELKPDPLAYSVAIGAASYAVTQQAVSVERGRKVVAAAAAFALTAAAVSVELGREVAVAAASFAISEQAAALEYGREVAASSAAFLITGASVSLERGHEIVADAASFAVTAPSASVEYGREFNADPASFAFTGADATFVYEPSTGLLILCEPASFAFSAGNVAVERGREIAVEGASFSYSGAETAVLHGYEVGAAASAFGFTGNDIDFRFRSAPELPDLLRKPGSRFNDRRFNEGGFRPLRK
jgi:hypothetical protein